MAIEPGTIQNVEFNKVKTEATNRVISSPNTGFVSPTRTVAGTCTYNNIVKEVLFTAFTEANEITSIVADVVYADLTGYECTAEEKLMFKQTFSFVFKSSEESRL